ncbi:MAG TPA: phage holin family protein [Candidatus Woesebacteria bacterium]|nr:phage holin family protein [Candidatus Woesebacteria bacterium]
MKKFIKATIISILTIAILSWFFPNINYSSSLTLIIAGVVLTLLEKLLAPLLKVLFLPINIVTLGLFSLVINVFVLYMATYLVPGFVINNVVIFGLHFNQFFSLLFASFLISSLQRIFALIL